MSRKAAALFLFLVFPVSSIAAPELPITYTMNSPLVPSDKPFSVRVYQTGDMAVARQGPADREDFYQKAVSGNPDWSMPGTWIAGERTGGRLAKMQNLGQTMYVTRELKSLEEGQAYQHETHDHIEWQVTDLAVSLERGSKDRTVAGLPAKHFVVSVAYTYRQTNHSDGDQTTKKIDVKRHFWFAEALPFSPVQLLPLHLTNNTFADLAPERIHEAIYARLEEQLHSKGMLVRAEMTMSGKTWTMEVSNLDSARELDLAAMDGFPLVPEAQSDNVIGALFLSRMLQGDLPDGGDFQVTLSNGESAKKENAAGQSAFTVSDDGDLGIAATFKLDNGDEGLLLIMRPWHGMPEEGQHPVVPRRSGDQVRGMSEDRLKEYAKGMQVFGIIDGKNRLVALSSATSGHITLNRAAENRLEGQMNIVMQAVNVGGDGGVGERTLTGSFKAVSGLDVRLRNAVTRRLK